MRLFNFTGDSAPKAPAPWTRGVSILLKPLFGLGGAQPQANPKDYDSLTDNTPGFQDDAVAVDAWKVVMDRKAMCVDVHAMDCTDGLIAEALDIIADNAVPWFEDDALDGEDSELIPQTTFKIHSKNPQVQRELEDMARRLNLAEELWQIVRNFVKYGTYLPEVQLDPSRKLIVGLRETVAWEIWPNVNGKGDKVPGWIYRRDVNYGYDADANDKLMPEWKIVPFHFGARHGFFTMPLLSSLRETWKRVKTLEDALAVTRLKSSDRYVHRVPVAPGSTVDQVFGTITRYKKAMSLRKVVKEDGTVSTQPKGQTMQDDMYLPDDGTGKGGVSVLAANNTQLGQLQDMHYHREGMLARIGVPITYLQLVSMQKSHLTAGAGLSGIDKQFARRCRRIQACLRTGLYRLCDTQLMLRGIVPTPGLYSIELGMIPTQDALQEAKIALTNAQAAAYFQESFGAMDPELIAEKFMDLTPRQKSLMKNFLSKYGDRVVKARIKALEEAAKPKPVGGGMKDRLVGGDTGSGNNNKSKASRSSEQKGGAKQSMEVIPLGEAVELFGALQSGVAQALQARGIDVSNQVDAEAMRQSLIDLAVMVEFEDEE